MYLAGHSDFETTHQFYLAVREDLLQRARIASAEALNGDFVAHLLRAPLGAQKELDSKCGKLLNSSELTIEAPVAQ